MEFKQKFNFVDILVRMINFLVNYWNLRKKSNFIDILVRMINFLVRCLSKLIIQFDLNNHIEERKKDKL